MAEKEGDTEEAATDEQPINSFSNDGSFIEHFKKMQEQKAKEEEEKRKREEAEKAQKMKPLFSITKTKPVISKLGGFRKGLMPGAKLKKPTGAAVKKVFAEDKQTDTCTESSSNQDNTGGSVSQDPPAASSEGSSSEQIGPPVKKKKSRFSDVPPPGVVVNVPSIPGRGQSSIAGPSGVQSSSTIINEGQTSAVGFSEGQSSSAGPSGTSSDASLVTPAPRKRKSRFSDAPPSTEDAAMSQVISSLNAPPVPAQSQALTETQRQQILEQIEINKMVAEIKAATQAANAQKTDVSAKYEYDSDEDTEGGTWEHKKRAQEMRTTFGKAKELTDMNKGKHHIGDFLPPEELNRFVEKVSAIKEGRNPDFSDYKDHKLTEENVGFKMLQKAGWTEGTGLGSNEDGILDPINKGKQSFEQSGVGAVLPAEVKKEDDPFDVYRKRMMLSYRFRPNPLNNPRRPYY